MRRADREERTRLAGHAHNVFVKARADGFPKPDKCSRCGKPTSSKKLHAHHPNYRKPLDVLWVCWKCHAKIHAFLNWFERGYQWLAWCQKKGIDPTTYRNKHIHKKTGLPTARTEFEHWLEYEYRPFTGNH